MKKALYVFFTLILFSTVILAQDRMLSIDDIFDPQMRVSFSGSPIQLRGWSSDGKSYLQLINGSMVRIDAITGEKTPLVDSLRMKDGLIRAGFQSDVAQRLATSPFQDFNGDESKILFSHENDIFVYVISDGSVKRLTKSDKEELEPAFSPDGRWISFVRDNNLYVVELSTAKERQLTRDGSETILNGYLDWIYEEEVYGRGNKRGYWWSPDSRFISFLRIDESRVPKFVIADDTVTNQLIENTDYPQSGDPNPLVKLGIAEVEKDAAIPNIRRIPKVGGRIPGVIARIGDVVKFVDLSSYRPEETLITRVTWTPDSSAVVFQAQDREQTYLHLNSADIQKGNVTRLLEERSRAWVEAIDNPEYLSDGSFIFQSARDGFKHLYLYSKEGKLIRQITRGKWDVTAFFGVDAKSNFAYFTASGQAGNWIDSHVYRINLDGSNLEQLTKTAGTHRAIFNSSFTHFIDIWSDATTAPQARLIKSSGELERDLDINPNPILAEYRISKPEFLKVKTRDGFEMEAMMIKPPDFDPNKTYPVFAYTYSGPYAPQVRNQWGGSRMMWHQMLAQQGYIIWICDNRTASGKGVESAWEVYRRMGQTETQDLEDGFNYLKSLPYVDGERLGMWGWSYGGYMTSYFMTHSKTLKMGIAGGLVGDWALYDSIYTERYMMTPQNNPEGYTKGSVIGSAKNLHGRLLIIHGMMDDNVHMQNSTKLIFELQKAGKQFDFMAYPTQRHGVTNPFQQKHMYSMMTDFIKKHL